MSLVHFRTYDGDWHIGGKYVGTDDSSFVLLSEGSERLRITTGGNVNIGGNYTQTTYTSQITGTLNVTSTITQDGATVATTGKAIAMAMVFG